MPPCFCEVKRHGCLTMISKAACINHKYNFLQKHYYFFVFCKNVGMFIPFSLTLLVTCPGCFKPGSGVCEIVDAVCCVDACPALTPVEAAADAEPEYVYEGLTACLGVCTFAEKPAIALFTLLSSRPVAITVIVAVSAA